jgi:prepilin-type N-terminal cleavage/methylation domain-containing protein
MRHVTRLRADRGFTLVEMLIAMVIAMVVSLASFSLIEVVMRRTGEITSRVETTQRARGAMDDMTRELRSQVCVLRSDPTLLTTARSVYAATPTSVTFFADLADESVKTATPVQPIPALRTLTLSGTKITDTIRPGVNDTANLGAVTYASATGETTRTVLTDVALIPGVALFRYYQYNTPTDGTAPSPTDELVPSGAGLTEAQLLSVARISIGYRVTPTGKAAGARGSTVLQDDITVRTVDPNTANPDPSCS